MCTVFCGQEAEKGITGAMSSYMYVMYVEEENELLTEVSFASVCPGVCWHR